MTASVFKQATFFACFLFLVVPWLALAHPDHLDSEIEHIENLDVAIRIREDSSIEVEETIYYAFTLGEEKHGIYRDIPVEYVTAQGTKRSMPVKVLSVENKTGTAYRYEESRTNGYLRVKIGDPDRFVKGSQVYVIRYEVENALGYFDDYDELYWNATGNTWTVPIHESGVTVFVPRPIEGSNLVCYVGPTGSTERCDGGAAALTGTRSEFPVRWNQPLLPGSGITVALSLPKGLVQEPTPLDRFVSFFVNNPFILLPFVVFGFMFRRWYRDGRDPKGRGIIIPEYDVPAQLSPLHIAVLQDGRLTGKEIPAAIIDLAVKGYLVIERVTEKVLLFNTTDYRLSETGKHPDSGSIEQVLLDSLFGSGLTNLNTEHVRTLLATTQKSFVPTFLKRLIETKLSNIPEPTGTEKRSIQVSELKNKFYTKIPDLQKRAVADLVGRGLLAASPQEVWGKYILWGGLFFMGIFFLAPLFDLQGASIVAILMTALIYFVFVYLMPRVTPAGAIMKEQLLGLKEYLQIAEKRRIEFHNAPEKTPELFERLLPAALLLGVSDIWAKEFADISMSEPDWYRGGNISSFSAASFASDLGGFNSAAGQSLASAPSGSGSAGGGSSGGGGGGGGGGSW